MVASLLVTQYQIPPQPTRGLHRARLVEALEQRIPRHKLTVVAAPAGYGKTTCLAQWAHTGAQQIAWYSISPADDVCDRFLRYLCAAWETVAPAIGGSRLALLLGSPAPAIDAVLAAFIQAASERQAPLIFVLDDYHLIEDPAIHDALRFLLDHAPPFLRFVLVGRGEPPLPLARYRARGELLELGPHELGFRPDESAAFLTEVMGLDLAPQDIATLHTQVEGWIAGLQLVALGRQKGLGDAATPAISGRQRFVADYLREDVLDSLPAALREFLLQTSILDRLSGPLCDAVTARDGGQARLEALERQGLFLLPLDDSRTWYRYHGLFADFLRAELARRAPDAVVGLHRRAAAWYLAQEQAEPAFHHALAGEDAAQVVHLFDHYLNAYLLSGELRIVQHWFDALPDAWLTAYPVLGLAQAGLFFFTGAVESCMRCIDTVEARLQPTESTDESTDESADRRTQMARVTALRCFMACTANNVQQAEQYADQALHALPEEDLGFRPGIYAALGDTYRRNARWDEAYACYARALTFERAPGVQAQSVHLYGALADLSLRQGRLHDAAAYWHKALASLEDREQWGHVPLPVAGWVYIRLGEIEYAWNQLDSAQEHLAFGLERAELGGDVRTLIAGYLLAARIRLTAGDASAAAAYLDHARPLVENAHFAEWTARFARLQLELWLAQDRLRAAVRWADTLADEDPHTQPPESEAARLAMARVLIVQGHAASLAQALTLLARLAEWAAAEGRAGILVETRALQAMAQSRQGDQAAAMTALAQALRLAEPEGHIRLFADLGLPMARLLQEADRRAVMPDYVAQLLAACHDVPASAQPQPLTEPLTPREQEVLAQMAAGLTNREIGDELVISPETVKKHAANIYGKLSVGNRTEAVARARELDLLD